MNFERYAIYFAAPADEDWARFATAWLGWDMDSGAEIAHPHMDGLDVAAITETPRRYGLHATLKPPFRLADGQSPDALLKACADLAARLPPVTLDGLQIARLGRFLALRPLGDASALDELAAACVRDLDGFRAPTPDAELTRRRANGLSAAQEANLVNWGYPYVLDEFRFHITLTGRLDKPTMAAVQAALDRRLGPLLPAPFVIRDLGLVGEAGDGRFHLIRRLGLSG
ncbi:DUF1045 domain-containing protein [Ruegeria sediminis]|uniref:DUF1045 domain-containing protein n=1 Tax=Ruegeria sediminis TaxID=2583820 RepID=A0ABY2WYB8_9RHOB|nr:DUF1045 domain-containing protein [Ruegeria sediminis]TMV07583.1 DUF1045 domain-containing protein [Ruegeria sediminis]